MHPFAQRVVHLLKNAEVDPKWRLDKVSSLIIGYNYTFGALLGFQALQFFISGGSDVLWQAMLVLAALSVVLAGAALQLLMCCSMRRVHVRLFETVETLSWLVPPLLLLTGTAWETDQQVRHRGFVMILAVSILPPLLLGMRLSLYTVLAVANFVMHVTFLGVSEQYFGRRVKVSTVLTTFVFVSVFYMLGVWHGRLLVTLQLAEESLRQQQKASQRLVSMLCDAWCLVGGDRETILASDGRFDSLMGRKMVGVKIPEVFPEDSNHDHQLATFHGFMAEAAAMEDDASSGSVRPMTMASATGAAVQVTVFAVKQKAVVSNETSTYLLGICQTLEEERGDVVASLSHTAALERGPPSEVPDLDVPSTISGSTDCFRCDDLNSVNKAIARIAGLGRSERWAVEPEEVDLKLECLGAGNFGSVVTGTYYGAQIVVKVVKGFDPHSNLKELSALCHEIRILRNCRHPNLVQFKGAVCDTTLNRVGLVLECIEDGDLWKWTCGMVRPSEAACFRVMVGVCNGLWYLHMHQPVVVHTDLKPQNVLVATQGLYVQAKLADFGLSSLRLRHGPRRGGTLRWMPPEHFVGKVPPAPGTDMFSFGRMMEFLIFRRAPLKDLTIEQVKAQLAAGKVAPPTWSEKPSVLEYCCQPMVDACLKVDRHARPTAKELRSLLVKLPSEEFDDEHQTAAKTIEESCHTSPWGEVLAGMADVPPGSAKPIRRPSGNIDKVVAL